MYLNPFINLFNNSIINFFNFIFKTFKIETLEDKFHNHKKNSRSMNHVKVKFKNEDDYNIVKNNILNMSENQDFLNKYDITTDSIINDTNNKIAVSFNEKSINIFFNHYHISGTAMFVLLNKMFNSKTPSFLKTNPFFGIINLPFYLYEIIKLKKKEYFKNEHNIEHFIVEKNVITDNKRCYLCLTILKEIYTSLQMNRPMIVAITLGFEELPYINNNLGLIIIQYEITDTIDSLDMKIKKASYQAYCSNFIINCPLPNFSNFEIRDYVDCIISSMYIKSDFDIEVAWNCAKQPVEQMYVGSVSVIRSNNTMDINMNFNTCSSNYKNSNINNFFK
jgi:hypothetical protein